MKDPAVRNAPRYASWAVMLLVVFSLTRSVGAQTIQTVELPIDLPAGQVQAAPANFSELLRALLLDSMRDEYVDERHWGDMAERFDGFHIRGLRISKRDRDVPHGFWHRYKVRLIRPEKTFKVQLSQEETLPSGAIPFSITISLRARCEATFIWWAYGVKGLNGTSVSDATLQLRLVLETSPQLKFSLNSAWPRLELKPRVRSVELKLKDLDLRRIGIVQGDLAKVIGDGSRKAVERLMQQQEGKIRQKLQKQIDDESP